MQVCAVLALVVISVSLVHAQYGNLAALVNPGLANPALLMYNPDLYSNAYGGMDLSDIMRAQQLQQMMTASSRNRAPTANTAAANLAAAAAVMNNNRNRNAPASTSATVNAAPNTQTYVPVPAPVVPTMPNYGIGLSNMYGLGTGGGNNAGAAALAYGTLGASMNEIMEYQFCVGRGGRRNVFMRAYCAQRHLH